MNSKLSALSCMSIQGHESLCSAVPPAHQAAQEHLTFVMITLARVLPRLPCVLRSRVLVTLHKRLRCGKLLEPHLLSPHAMHCGVSGRVIWAGAGHVLLAKVLAEPPVILLLHILVGVPDDIEIILGVSTVHEAAQGCLCAGPLPAFAAISPVA